MSTSEDRTRAWRVHLFPWLPGSDFDETLALARKRHADTPDEDPEVHLGAVIEPFVHRNVPVYVAKWVAQEIILNEQPAG